MSSRETGESFGEIKVEVRRVSRAGVRLPISVLVFCPTGDVIVVGVRAHPLPQRVEPFVESGGVHEGGVLLPWGVESALGEG